MTIIRRILDNPAAVVGIIRAVLLAAIAYGAHWISPPQADAILNLLTATLPLLSLALTGISATATDAKIQQALATPAPGQPGDPGAPDAT